MPAFRTAAQTMRLDIQTGNPEMHWVEYFCGAEEIPEAKFQTFVDL